MRSAAVILAITLGCNSPLDQRLALVDQPRVLAITAEPPEAKPGVMVTYGVLVAAPDGPAVVAPSWAYCTAPKPPTEDDIVAPACLGDTQIVDLGAAATVTGTLPADDCALYGPDTPPGNFRPRDPDATGGYFQPVRATATFGGAELVAFGLSRITCNLPTAPTTVAHDYQLHYVGNTNPTLLPLVLGDAGGAALAIDAVPAGTTVTLVASWPATAVENYLYYDASSETLVTRREAMHVSWYATGGSIAVDASAVDEAAPATTVSTTWQTPAAGSAWLWVVLRDSRGGIATQTIAVTLH
ncbi:MAG: hypothetical protein ABI591_12470 [Kofleriaceae bacterium]